MSPRWHLPAGLEIVQCPPLQPGLPVVWCPSIVAAAFARQLRAAGYRRPLPRALIERALADAWLAWVSPVAYAARCRAELGG